MVAGLRDTLTTWLRTNGFLEELDEQDVRELVSDLEGSLGDKDDIAEVIDDWCDNFGPPISNDEIEDFAQTIFDAHTEE